MFNLSKPQATGSCESPGLINRNAYNSVAPELCKQILLTTFKLSYKGGNKDVRSFVRDKKIKIVGDIQDFYSYCIEDYDVTLLQNILANDEICNLGTFVKVKENKSGRVVKGESYKLDHLYWRNEKLYGEKHELPSLEFYIKEIVYIRNEAFHNQRDDMTEKILKEKLNILKYTLQEMILRMRIRFPDACYRSDIKGLETILKEKEITVPIWKDLTASLGDNLMEKVFECIENDKEVDIRLPSLENEQIRLNVPPSRVYLNIKGKGSNRRQISSTHVVKELRDPQNFPNRCLVLVGLPGVGKTTSLFRIKEEHKYAIKNKKLNLTLTSSEFNHLEFEAVEDIECIIYLALRNNEHKSLSELLHYKYGPATEKIIPHSRQLQHIILRRPSILLLDAIDESSAASDQLIREIWQIKDNFPNLYMIFTTRGSTGNILRECTGEDYDKMCIYVTGLDPSEFLENAGKLIDVILGERSRERNLGKRKQEALSNLQKIRQKFPPVCTNPLLLTIAVRLVLDPYVQTLDNLHSVTQLIKGMMDSLKRRLCDNTDIEADTVVLYLEFLENESLGMLQRNEFLLNSSLTKILRDKIRSLGINEVHIEKVLQSFLSKKDESVFQHLHAITQSFLAANALRKKLVILCPHDLNLEINKQMKDIPKEHQQTVLMLLVGILHEHEKNDILNEIASNVCIYFDFPQYNYFDSLQATQIHLFQESLAGGSGKPNEILEREIISKAPDSINVSEEAMEALQYIMTREEKKNWPKEITITIHSHPDNILNLRPVLDLLNKRNSCMELEVHQCSEALLRTMPDNLERLMVHWKLAESVKMVDALNTSLPSLHKLNMLTIDLDEGGSLPEEGLPELYYHGTLLVININIKFSDDDVVEAARIMAWVCGQHRQMCNGLYFYNSSLTEPGCTALLYELKKRGVQAKWIGVHDAQLAVGERESLQKKSESLGFRIFMTPGRVFFDKGQSMTAAMNEMKADPHLCLDLFTFGVEVLSGTDPLLTGRVDTLIREFKRISTASVSSDRLQLDECSNISTSLQDDFRNSLSEAMQAMLCADFSRFFALMNRIQKFLSKDDVQSSDFGGYMDLFRDFIRSAAPLLSCIPKATELQVAAPLQLNIPDAAALQRSTSTIVNDPVLQPESISIDTSANDNIMENKTLVEEDFELD